MLSSYIELTSFTLSDLVVIFLRFQHSLDSREPSLTLTARDECTGRRGEGMRAGRRMEGRGGRERRRGEGVLY